MKKKLLIKTFALGIVALFISAGLVSAFNVNPTVEFKSMNRGSWWFWRRELFKDSGCN
jgi:hypothetical protein